MARYASPHDDDTPVEHAAKKRRTGPAYRARQSASYSNTQTPRYARSGSDTVSTDRTTELHTTAPTSMGSNGSGGSGGSGGVYADGGAVGQKRKRITRQTTADEKKRKDLEAVGDAYSYYVPPPKPPIKAKEVYVQVVKDVGDLARVCLIRC
jgi:dual-specificity kinase